MCSSDLRPFRRLSFSGEDRRRVAHLVQHHMFHYRPEWTDAAVRRLIKEVGDNLDDLIAFSRADLTSKRAERVDMVRSLLTELQIRILEVREADAVTNPLPKGIGNLIMERLHIEPGPQVGRLRDELIAAIDAGKIQPNQDGDVYIQYLMAREVTQTDEGG